MLKHRYYLTQRPPGIGTQPKGFVKMVDYGDKKPLSDGTAAWGYVDYGKKLTEHQIKEYELKYGGQINGL